LFSLEFGIEKCRFQIRASCLGGDLYLWVALNASRIWLASTRLGIIAIRVGFWSELAEGSLLRTTGDARASAAIYYQARNLPILWQERGIFTAGIGELGGRVTWSN
jgi:hypothetical protein